MYAQDPVERLQIVRDAMQGVKESKQALGAEVISGLEDFAPPTLLAMASRLNFSTRLFNLIVTNVPGPQFPLYLLGREMQAIVPVAFLPEDHALAIAAMSYNGNLFFGLLGDYDAMPDLDELAGHFQASLDELKRAAAPKRKAAAKSSQAAGAREGHRGRQLEAQALRTQAQELGRRAEVLGRQAASQRERLLIQARGLQVRGARAYSSTIAPATVVPAHPGRLERDAAGGVRPPVQAQRRVDGDEHVADPVLALDHHHAANVGRSGHQPLPDAHQLELAARVHAVRTGAVLARHLPHARVHAQPGAARPRSSPAAASKRSSIRTRGSASGMACANAIVPGWKTAARPPARRSMASKPPVARGPHRARVASRHRVALAERHDRARPRQPQRLRQLAGRHPEHQRARDRGVERGVLREALGDQADHGKSSSSLSRIGRPATDRQETFP